MQISVRGGMFSHLYGAVTERASLFSIKGGGLSVHVLFKAVTPKK